MQMDPDSDSRIRIQKFLCGPKIHIGSKPYGTDPLLRIQLGCKQSSCVKGTFFKASGGPGIPYPDFSRRTVFRVGPDPPIPLFCGPPEQVRIGWSQFKLANSFRGIHQNAWMPAWSINAVSARFVRFVRFI
jgi:hypothetical protein